MRKSILVSRPKTTLFHCRIREDVHQRLRAVQAQLKTRGGAAIFPVDQIVEEALERAAQLAEKELARAEPPR